MSCSMGEKVVDAGQQQTYSVRGCLQDFKMLLTSSYGVVLMCRGTKGDNGDSVHNLEGKA